MTSDRELLELAAKAAGLEAKPAYHENGDGCGLSVAPGYYWNPIDDDGDALRLAVKLRLQITPDTYNKNEFTAYLAGWAESMERWSTLQDDYAATRRAIVRAAAEIGRGMK